ncbi:MAG TPA: hypothetical protein VFT80_10065, partial [Actinomycetota bacterium]|nr:hypothetical protein [Actinomycetota bacterium]
MTPVTVPVHQVGLAVSEPVIGDLVARRHPALDRVRRDGAREHDDAPSPSGPPSPWGRDATT